MKNARGARLLIFVGVALLFASIPTRVEACGCGIVPFPTRETRLEEVRLASQSATAVFIGEVTSRSELDSTLTVGRVFKGPIAASVRMRHKIHRPDGVIVSNSCTRTFANGAHVVFAREVSPGLFVASVCGPSALVEHSKETIEFLETLFPNRAKTVYDSLSPQRTQR